MFGREEEKQACSVVEVEERGGLGEESLCPVACMEPFSTGPILTLPGCIPGTDAFPQVFEERWSEREEAEQELT